MLGFNGGRIGGLNSTTAGPAGASGLWFPREQSLLKQRGAWPWGPNEVPNVGDPFGGGFFAGYISHTANGVATHALIVAPSATGATGTGYTLTTNYVYQTATQQGAFSTFDGAANTAVLVNSPAANFCKSLTIGGYNDWYLPARLELDIAYTGLKPSTDSNNTSFGINAYSVPTRSVNNTVSVPAQTSNLSFRTGGSEAFVANLHWASNQNDDANAVAVTFTNNFLQVTSKPTAYRVRAFRKIAL